MKPGLQEGLHKYLKKCEVEYIANHGGDFIEFIADFAKETQEEYAWRKFLNQYGFRVKEFYMVDDEKWI